MTVSRRINLFDLTLIAPPVGRGGPVNINLNHAVSAITCLTYDTSDYGLPSNRYFFDSVRRARYAMDFRAADGLYVGIISRNDLDGGQTENAGVITDLRLGTNDGLHHATHFVVDPVRRRLLLESTALGPRPSDFERYMQDRLNGQLATGVEACQLSPRVDTSLIDKFERDMGSLASLEISVLPQNIGHLTASPHSGIASEVRAVRDGLSGIAQAAPRMELVSLVMKRRPFARRGGLGPRWKRLAAVFARDRSSELHQLRVRVENAPDDSGRSIALDLLSAKTSRLLERIPTRTSRRIIVSDDMFALMIDAYNAM